MRFAKWNLYERPRSGREWRRREEIDWCDGRLQEMAEKLFGRDAGYEGEDLGG
jgi:hypothetical protein